MTCLTKKLYLGLICPQDVFPEGFWLASAHFCKLRSNFLMRLRQQWVLLGLRPARFISFRRRWMVGADAATARAGLGLDWGCLSTIRTIPWCNVPSIFLFRPHLGRFAPVPWALNFLMMLHTMDRRTLRSLEMALNP